VIAIAALVASACKGANAPHHPVVTDEASYAARLRVEIEAGGGVHGLEYDGDRHTLHNDQQTISITNLYAEWQRTPVAQRDAAITRVAKAMVTSPALRNLASVQPRLLPILRASLYFELFALRETNAPVPPHRMIGELAAVGVGIDHDDTIEVVGSKQLGELHTTFDALYSRALANLAKRPVKFERVGHGVWASVVGDSYDATRLLLIDEIRKLPIKDPVALVPNRDTLLLASEHDSRALSEMGILAAKVRDEPRPIHEIALCLRAAGWEECEPAPSEGVAHMFHDLATMSRGQIYEEQREPLQAHVGDNVFVAKLGAVEDKTTKKLSTYAVLTRSVPTLLPRADRVGLVEVSGKNVKVLGMVPWARFMEVARDHLEPDNRSPPRWATGSWFPSDDELLRLAPTLDPDMHQ